MSQQKFAVFDIDGTIFRWQLYHELFDALVADKSIAPDEAKRVFDAREGWRSRKLSYIDYETILVEAMEKTIVGLSESRFHAIADTIMLEKGHHVYRYTVDLLQRLKTKGYMIIAISGSHQQLVERFATLHDIDIAVGRKYETKDGRLTNMATPIAGRKDEVLREIVKAHNLTWHESYGIGDSTGDVKMLASVDHPIAFNPSGGLKNEAMRQGWPIVIERKSMSYRLEKGHDGTYLLAETIEF